MTTPALSDDAAPKVADLDELLERAFWHFDALHKAHYRDVSPKLPGPMAEREAFKCTVRSVILDTLGVTYERSLRVSESTGARKP